MKKIDKGTIIRTCTLIIAIVNQIVAAIGATSYASSAWYQIFSIVATTISAVWSAWENNDFTYYARLGTAVLDALEDGTITPDEIEKIINYNKDK